MTTRDESKTDVADANEEKTGPALQVKRASMDSTDEEKSKLKEYEKIDVAAGPKDLTNWAGDMATLNSPTKQGKEILDSGDVNKYGDMAPRLGRVREYYNKGGLNYDDLWGKGNIHFGIFPDLDKGVTEAELMDNGATFLQGANNLNDLMIKLGGIDKDSRVLDFGSGFGGPARYLASEVGATVLGIDLSEENCRKATSMAEEEGVANLVSFQRNSFLELPENVTKAPKPWTHIWNQLGICHCYAVFDDICKSANKVLPIGGRIVWNDYTGNKDETDLVRRFVCDLMHYSHLITTAEYLEVVERNGFVIEHHFCEEWKKHFLFGHDLLIKRALELQIPKSAEWYRMRKLAVNSGLYSNQLVIARKVREL